MKLSVVIPHYWAEREDNLKYIVRALRSGTVQPDEILIWNNDRHLEPIEGASIIQSPRNYGCLGRFIAAYCARGEYVMFQDNDTCVTETTVEKLLYWAQRRPNSIVSIDGWSFDGEPDYRRGVETLCYGWGIGKPEMAVTAPTEVDVTPGHMELLSRKDLMDILTFFPFEDSTVMEDIWFNWCAKQAGVKRYVVPCLFKYLTECGVGICFSETFFAERDELCKRLFS